MLAVIEKEIALIMHETSLLMHKYIIVRQSNPIKALRSLQLFTRGLLSCSLQSKECQNKPNLL